MTFTTVIVNENFFFHKIDESLLILLWVVVHFYSFLPYQLGRRLSTFPQSKSWSSAHPLGERCAFFEEQLLPRFSHPVSVSGVLVVWRWVLIGAGVRGTRFESLSFLNLREFFASLYAFFSLPSHLFSVAFAPTYSSVAHNTLLTAAWLNIEPTYK